MNTREVNIAAATLPEVRNCHAVGLRIACIGPRRGSSGCGASRLSDATPATIRDVIDPIKDGQMAHQCPHDSNNARFRPRMAMVLPPRGPRPRRLHLTGISRPRAPMPAVPPLRIAASPP